MSIKKNIYLKNIYVCVCVYAQISLTGNKIGLIFYDNFYIFNQLFFLKAFMAISRELLIDFFRQYSRCFD